MKFDSWEVFNADITHSCAHTYTYGCVGCACTHAHHTRLHSPGLRKDKGLSAILICLSWITGSPNSFPFKFNTNIYVLPWQPTCYIYPPTSAGKAVQANLASFCVRGKYSGNRSAYILCGSHDQIMTSYYITKLSHNQFELQIQSVQLGHCSAPETS